jgi:hypothetical protein
MPRGARSLTKARSLIEVALRGLGADPDAAAIRPDEWLVAKGSATVVVRLVPQEDEGKPPHLQVASPVMKSPPNPAFKDRLLAFNYEMGGLACFCVTPSGEVQIVSSRDVDGISATEVARLIAHVAHFSDLYDDRLLTEFGQQFAIHPPKPGAKPPASGPAKGPPKP